MDYNYLAESLAALAGVPVSILLGAALGQLASKGGKESSKEDDHETH